MAYLLVRHSVEDYTKWRPVFDGNEAMRSAAGAKSARVFRSADDPNEIVTLMEWDEIDDARRLGASDDLRQAMERAGVVGRPDVLFLKET